MDAAWKKSMKFTSGTGVVYKPNVLVEQDVSRAAKLASEITIGSVSPSITVFHRCDYRVPATSRPAGTPEHRTDLSSRSN